jgi:Zn-finger protein
VARQKGRAKEKAVGTYKKPGRDVGEECLFDFCPLVPSAAGPCEDAVLKWRYTRFGWIP